MEVEINKFMSFVFNYETVPLANSLEIFVI